MEQRKQCQKCLCWFLSDDTSDGWVLCPHCGDQEQKHPDRQDETKK